MKYYYALIIGMLLFPLWTLAQCPTEDLRLTTQAEVDQFFNDYPNCTKFEKSLTFHGGTIVNIDGLSSIEEASNLVILNTSVTTISLPNLAIITTNRLQVEGNYLLTSASFPNLISAPDFKIKDGNVLETLILTELTSTSKFELSSCPKLKVLNLDNVTNLGNFGIWFSDDLQSINLSKLTSTSGWLIIADTGLEYLYFPELVESKHIDITLNAKLKEIHLNKLKSTEIEETYNFGLRIEWNENLELFSIPNYESSIGQISIVYNPKLTELDFPSLVTADLGISLLDHQAVTRINLPKLTTSKTIFEIDNFRVLNELNVALLNETGDFTIEKTGLNNLDTFENLLKVNGNLRIYKNDDLSNCSGICNLINAGGVSNFIFISDNPAPCDNASSLTTTCKSLSIDDIVLNGVKIFPNPTQDHLTIQMNNLSDVKFVLSDTAGRIVLKNKLINQSIDLSHLSKGLYYLTLKSLDSQITHAILKQ